MFDQNLSLVFGTFWAWKTYYAVREAFDAFNRWAIVISNTWLSFPHIRFYVPSDLPSILQEISRYHVSDVTPSVAPYSYLKAHNIDWNDDIPREFFILIDEGGLFFNARNFQKNFSDDSILEMLVQPRKYGLQITAIVQDLQLIDKVFRVLSQEIVELVPTFMGFFRKAYSYDKKYILVEWWWTPDIPVLESKSYFHWWNKRTDRIRHFWGLYYTREILWSKAIRYDEDIFTLAKYIQLEKEDLLKDNSRNILTPVIEKIEWSRFITKPFKYVFSKKLESSKEIEK